MRSYSDYASRSPVPARSDDMLTTVRNSPALVDASLPRRNFMLHFDGEFSSLNHLVRGTLTGRNMGWLPGEEEIAIEHLCKIIRGDDGKSALAEEFGGYSYTEVFSGKTTNETIVTSDFLIPEHLRIDPHKEDCDKVFKATAEFIAIYTDDLVFAQDKSIISPYDLFLKLNNLPVTANEEESHQEYSTRLMTHVDELYQENKLKFVTENPNTEDGKFQFHDEQPFEFGEKQLAGMRIFFSAPEKDKISVGNCVACHPAPHFTDFSLHNTGITQVEYEAIHGQNAFNKLKIPNVNQREKQAEIYLPATRQHPNRKGFFRSIPSQENILATDLGAWNILFNSDFSLAQESIYSAICLHDGFEICTSRNDTLERSIATFKTPGLRNLGHSAPYMHNGLISDLHAVVSFYLAVSINTREGLIRNPDQDIANIHIKPKDIEPLAAFLVSLYEDYN